MISVEGDFVRTCCTGEGEFGIKRGNIGVLAGFGLFLAGIERRFFKTELVTPEIFNRMIEIYSNPDFSVMEKNCYIFIIKTCF